MLPGPPNTLSFVVTITPGRAAWTPVTATTAWGKVLPDSYESSPPPSPLSPPPEPRDIRRASLSYLDLARPKRTATCIVVAMADLPGLPLATHLNGDMSILIFISGAVLPQTVWRRSV